MKFFILFLSILINNSVDASAKFAYANIFKPYLKNLNSKKLYKDKKNKVNFYFNEEAILISGHQFLIPISCLEDKMNNPYECMMDSRLTILDTKNNQKKETESSGGSILEQIEALISTMIESVFAFNNEYKWVSSRGYPFKISVKSNKKKSFYCYGMFFDGLDDIELLCPASRENFCPEISKCYKNRFINGVLK